jgi:hypothetical protein
MAEVREPVVLATPAETGEFCLIFLIGILRALP